MDHIQHLLATAAIYYLLLKKGSTKISAKRFITPIVEYFCERNYLLHACMQNSLLEPDACFDLVMVEISGPN